MPAKTGNTYIFITTSGGVKIVTINHEFGIFDHSISVFKVSSSSCDNDGQPEISARLQD